MTTTTTALRAAKVLGATTLPVAIAGGVGLWLRERFQRQTTYVPDRYPNGIWNPKPFGLSATDVWFSSEDGVDLHGWWIPHRRARATILYCHGNSGSIAHQIGVLRHMRRLKANLFAFDYRGYGRSDGRPDEAGLYRDVRAAWDHLVGALGQDPARTLVFGHSLGGAVAIDCATHRPVGGLIAQATFTDMRSAARAMFPSVPLHVVARNRFRSIEKVGAIAAPKLFIHGRGDATFPARHAEELFAAASEPKELYLVSHAGHNDLYRHGGSAYLRRLARFRDTCLSA